MKRTLTPLIAAVAVLAPATAANAGTIEIGRTKAVNQPSCTAETGVECQVVTRITGVQYQIGKVKNPFVVPRDGKVYAFTVSLGKLTKLQIAFFSKASYKVGGKTTRGLGLGDSTVRLTALRAVRKAKNNYHFAVIGQSPDVLVEHYFGSSAQFFLSRALQVRKGDLLALTVPTWAPALATNLDRDTSWRASRNVPCATPAGQIPDQFAQLRTGVETQYFCNYRTARLTYTASLGIEPRPTSPLRSRR